MAGNKISAFTAQSDAIASGDLFPMVDVSDTSQGPGGKTKKATRTQVAAGVSAEQVGAKTVTLPASAMRPTVSNGCAALADFETTSGRPDISHLAFDGSSAEFAQFSFRMPKSWDRGTLTYAIHWTGVASGAGGVAWTLEAVACGDDDTIDVAYGTAVTVTDTFITAEDVHDTGTSGALTVAGSPAVGDRLYFRVGRNPAHASDTRSEDANLLGLTIFYTVNAVNDN